MEKAPQAIETSWAEVVDLFYSLNLVVWQAVPREQRLSYDREREREREWRGGDNCLGI